LENWYGKKTLMRLSPESYSFLSFATSSPYLEEINFWQPGGRTNFQAN
jgi:hypothetical protein